MRRWQWSEQFVGQFVVPSVSECVCVFFPLFLFPCLRVLLTELLCLVRQQPKQRRQAGRHSQAVTLCQL